jgi:hypothetical protein
MSTLYQSCVDVHITITQDKFGGYFVATETVMEFSFLSLCQVTIDFSKQPVCRSISEASRSQTLHVYSR